MNFNFNNFFAIFYQFFFLAWITIMVLIAYNLDLSTLEAIGAGVITGVLLGIEKDIGQFYFRKRSGGD